jgi:hypothetical protein
MDNDFNTKKADELCESDSRESIARERTIQYLTTNKNLSRYQAKLEEIEKLFRASSVLGLILDDYDKENNTKHSERFNGIHKNICSVINGLEDFIYELAMEINDESILIYV